jgi:hypothetical protein
LGLGRTCVLGGVLALALLCGQELSACELVQKPKPANRVQPKRDVVADIQKRLGELLRPSPGSSLPSRRIILQ